MSKFVFTKATLEALPRGNAAYIRWDEGYKLRGSLGVRVAVSGEGSIFIQYRAAGKQSKKTLAHLSDVLKGNTKAVERRIAELHVEADAWVRKAQEAGLTTSELEADRREAQIAQRAELKAANAAAMTFADLADEYIALRAEDTSSYPAYADGGYQAARLAAIASKVWKDKAVRDLVGRDAKNLIDYTTKHHGVSTALKLKSLLRPMLRYAAVDLGLDGVKGDLFDTTKIETPAPSNKVLNDDERKLFFTALRVFEQTSSSTKAPAEAADCIRFIYLTAARQCEVYGMRWSDITYNDDGTVDWFRPKETRKMGDAHTMTLPTAAVKVLERVKDRQRAERRPCRPSDYVWPNRGPSRNGKRSPHRKGIRGAFQAVLSLAGLEGKITPHSLRASRATQWVVSEGVDIDTVGKLMGSSPQILKSVYVRDILSKRAKRDLLNAAGDDV